MSNRVMNTDKETDVKYIKKVTANPAKAATAQDNSKAGVKANSSADKAAPKAYGMPCLPQHSD